MTILSDFSRSRSEFKRIFIERYLFNFNCMTIKTEVTFARYWKRQVSQNSSLELTILQLKGQYTYTV